MARQNTIITFTGKLGNLIGYRRKGRYFMRSIPAVVRQTAATRMAAQRFGMASRKAALIRRAFRQELTGCADSTHINRLNRTLIQAGHHEINAVKGFRFDEKSSTEQFFRIAPRFTGDGVLHIPAQALPVIAGIKALEVKVIAACINFHAHRVVDTDAAVVVIDTHAPFAGTTIPMHIPKEGIWVIALQVKAMYAPTTVSDSPMTAAEIISVVTPTPTRRRTVTSYQHPVTGDVPGNIAGQGSYALFIKLGMPLQRPFPQLE
ncbi:hypothetical protein [Chitinophaga rhizophila]|uniref:Uncharacterized protein n=1 Tax=Chitinophaga rhizophila TaxID=2866212 RepID=A0ABS7GD51_9BACT|nr:hypothetical protein [Chitinophaga rhizophila]MBW8685601.1 hypothetical protein [Chitinophaga rhizophila]